MVVTVLDNVDHGDLVTVAMDQSRTVERTAGRGRAVIGQQDAPAPMNEDSLHPLSLCPRELGAIGAHSARACGKPAVV